MAAWLQAQHRSTDVTAPLGTKTCCRQTQLAYHMKPSAVRPGTQALIGHGYACGQAHTVHISAANAPPASQQQVYSQVPHTVIPAATPQCCARNTLSAVTAFSAPHPRTPAPVQLRADRLGGQHSGTRSEPRAAAGLHPAQARPWYPYRRFDAPQPCVWCALSSCTGSAVVLLDGAHAAEAGHAGVHAQPGQRNVRAPAARACWLSTGLGQYAVQPRMRVAGRGALQGMLSQAQVGKGCPSRAA